MKLVKLICFKERDKAKTGSGHFTSRDGHSFAVETKEVTTAVGFGWHESGQGGCRWMGMPTRSPPVMGPMHMGWSSADNRAHLCYLILSRAGQVLINSLTCNKSVRIQNFASNRNEGTEIGSTLPAGGKL